MQSVTGACSKCKRDYSAGFHWTRLRNIRPSVPGEVSLIRSCYIVSYDISDRKRLRRIHRKMRGFGDPLQYSVFRCVLSPSERILMLEALSEIIHHREDQVMLISLGPADGRVSESVEILGRGHDRSREERVAVIV